jgi:hypothetical protein
MSKKIFIAILLLIFVSWLVLVAREDDKMVKEITDFDECVIAGNPVMESYPRQCRADGKIFVENIGNEFEKSDFIKINNPRPNQIITSPLTIEGEARGIWFFEATFPVVLTDWDGLIIGESYATAQGEWMTEEFVPFKGTLEFKTPDYSNKATLILRKDNPSGLPQFDDALEIPVFIGDNKYKTGDSDGNNILPFDSGVRGVVTIGPMCPVVREGDDSCNDRPFKTLIEVFRENNADRSVAEVESGGDGKYEITLSPGEYIIHPIGGQPFPRCGEKKITVNASAFTDANLSCDSGIR